MKIVENWKDVEFDKIIELYHSVGWSNYTNDPSLLRKAFQNSAYVAMAIQDNKVCGLVRSISDDISIHYLQDILIDPQYQRQGIGRKLFNSALERFSHVRTHILLTDNEEKQISFYKSLGYSNTRDLKEIPLNAFVQMKGIELK